MLQILDYFFFKKCDNRSINKHGKLLCLDLYITNVK